MATIIDLGQKVKAKYPEYADMSDEEVGRRTKAKYPEYSDFEDVTPATAQPAPSFLEKAGQTAAKVGTAVDQFGVGALKGLGSTLTGAASLGEKIISAPSKALGLTPKDQQTGGEMIRATGITTPQGTAQKLGFGAEQVAEFFAPIPGGAKTKVAEKIVEKVPALTRLAELGLKAAGEGAEVAGRSALQKGTVAEIPKDFAIGSAFPLAGGLIKPLAGFAGKVGAAALGKSTGAGEEVIKEAFKNPSVIKLVRSAAQKEGGQIELQEKALSQAQAGLKKIYEKRSADYVRELNKLKQNPEDWRVIVQNAQMKTAENLAEASVVVPKGRGLTDRSFRTSAIEQGKSSVIKAYNELRTWKDFTPAGLDRLKKKLDQFKNATRNTTDGSYALIKSMRDSIDDGLKANIPQYSKMVGDYRQASDLIDDIESAVGLRDTVAKETAIKKIVSSLRQNNELRKDFLQTLGLKGGGDILGTVAAAQLVPLAPRGLAGAIVPGAILAAVSPQNLPLTLLYIASSSPRLAAEFVSVLGQAKGTVITPVLKKSLQAILVQAMKESGDVGSKAPTIENANALSTADSRP